MDLEDLPQGVRHPYLATPEAVVERFIEAYSRPGELVFDPFAGYGSTLRVAARLGRRACGIELDPERHAHASASLPAGTPLHLGDARDLASLGLPSVDLCFTGPPFFYSAELMRTDIPCFGRDYEEHLDLLGALAAALAERMRPGAHLVALYSHLHLPAGFLHPGDPAGLLPLAWDAARAIARALPLLREEIWCITDGPGRSPFAGRHGHFLIHRKPD
jgi:hypothetical protein